MRFRDLQEQDRIEYIKSAFLQILEELNKEPTRLVNYLKLNEAEQDFELKKKLYKEIESIVSKIPKSKNCRCGTCIDTSVINSVIPEQLNVLLEVAIKKAEEQEY